jgi:hypothetical protein
MRIFLLLCYYSMSSPVEVESVAKSQATVPVESGVEGQIIESSDEVRDMIDVPVEEPSVEPSVDGQK